MSSDVAYKVLLALPAWNEEQSIGGVLQELKTLYPRFDILVINLPSWVKSEYRHKLRRRKHR